MHTFNLGLDNVSDLQSFAEACSLQSDLEGGWTPLSPASESAHYIQLLCGALLELIPDHWNLEMFSFSPLVLS